MEQSIPGSLHEPFFELLHPNASLPPSSSPQNGALDPPPPSENPDNIVPSYDFQPIRPNSSTKSVDAAADEIKGRPLSTPENYSQPKTYPSSEPPRTFEAVGKSQEERELYNLGTVAAVERTVKKYADNLLHVLEGMSGRLSQLEITAGGMSGRLSQLETTVQGLQHSIGVLQVAEGENHGQTNERLGRLEQFIKEVQMGVQLLHDKREVADAKSELMKLQLATEKAALAGGTAQTPVADGWQQAKGEVIPHHLVSSPLPPQQSVHHHQIPPPSKEPVQHPHAPPPHPQALAASQQPPSSQVSVNVPNEPGVPTIQQPLPPHQQQHVAIPHLSQPPPHSMQVPPFYSQPQQQHQSSYSQQMEVTPYGVQPPPHLSAPVNPPSSSYIPELPYVPGNYEGPRLLATPQQPLPSSQQHVHSGPQQIFEPMAGRMGPSPSGVPTPYAQPPQSLPAVPMYETPSAGYGTQPYRVAQPVPSAPSGGTGYPRLPTAQPLQHALPAPSGASSTNRVPIDEVIEKVAAMGFSREQVKAVVRRLTENGQSVDLNVVLDKLMHGGGEFQPQKGWYSR